MNRDPQREIKPPPKAARPTSPTYPLTEETGPESYQEILKRELARKRSRETTILPKFEIQSVKLTHYRLGVSRYADCSTRP